MAAPPVKVATLAATSSVTVRTPSLATRLPTVDVILPAVAVISPTVDVTVPANTALAPVKSTAGVVPLLDVIRNCPLLFTSDPNSVPSSLRTTFALFASRIISVSASRVTGPAVELTVAA